MKRIPFEQMIMGLDDLFFRGDPLSSIDDVTRRMDVIEAYIEACGWSWDDIIGHMAKED